MTFVELKGRQYNLDLAQKVTFLDLARSTRLYWSRNVFAQLVYADQGEYDTDKAAILAAIGGSTESGLTVQGDLTVVGSVRSQGQDGNLYRAAWNMNLNDTQDGPVDEALGIAFTRITLPDVTGTGQMLFTDFMHLPAPFNKPPHVYGQVVGDATKQDDPFTVIEVTTTGFSFDGHPLSVVDIQVVASQSYIG